jgi:ribosome-interacting GTPase 1
MNNTKRDKEIINKYLNDKMSLSKTGSLYNLSKERIRQILNNNDIKPRKYTVSKYLKYSKDDINAIIKEHYNKRKSLYRIFKSKRISSATFYKYLDIYKIKFSNRHYSSFIKYDRDTMLEAINDRLKHHMKVNDVVIKYNITKEIFFYYLRKYKQGEF